MDEASRTRRGDGADWSWPPSSEVAHLRRAHFHTEDWAPASTVRRPWVRIGRWTLLYRRAARPPIRRARGRHPAGPLRGVRWLLRVLPGVLVRLPRGRRGRRR